MECPRCGYVMDHFTAECPRCAWIERARPPVFVDPPANGPSSVHMRADGAYVPQAMAAPPRPSGFATAALVLALIGPFTAFLGFVFGILALVQIHYSRGKLTGTTNAIAGVVLSVFSVTVLLPAFMWVLPRLEGVKQRVERATTTVNRTIETTNKISDQLKPLLEDSPDAPAAPNAQSAPKEKSSPSFEIRIPKDLLPNILPTW